MAVSRDTSNGPDWKDIASALLYFQEDHKLSLTVLLSVCGSPKAPDILLELGNGLGLDQSQELERSVWTQFRLGRSNLKTLEAAILRAIHELDYQLVVASGPTGEE